MTNLVELLQQANKREANLEEALERGHRSYKSLYEELMAYKRSDLCMECRTRRDKAWYAAGEYRTYEKCEECKHKGKTIAVLKREIAEKEKQIRYWQDCYETALRERTEM